MKRRSAFSLVELLVVMGIIGILIAILLPALSRARVQAKTVACQSNLQQIGQALLMYANNNGGWIYPPLGYAWLPPERRWPVFVFKPAVHNPPVMLCPADIEPVGEHSYLLNDHLYLKRIKYTTKVPGRTSSDIILMGEKRTDHQDFYMGFDHPPASDYVRVVEPYRHGMREKSGGSNYLFLDLHVERQMPKATFSGADPWDLPQPEETALPPP